MFSTEAFVYQHTAGDKRIRHTEANVIKFFGYIAFLQELQAQGNLSFSVPKIHNNTRVKTEMYALTIVPHTVSRLIRKLTFHTVIQKFDGRD